MNEMYVNNAERYNMSPSLPGLQKLIEVVAAIRDPKTGCPWDLAQSHESLMKYFFEELHEFNEALHDFSSQDPRTWEELSDCLLQIALHSRMLEEQGLSSLDQIAWVQAQKLISRHPHVFDPKFERFKTADEVNQNWEKIKAWAKQKKPAPTSVLQTSDPKGDSAVDAAYELKVPRALSSLQSSSRIGEKAANYGFDWKNASDVLHKITEEAGELLEAQNSEEHAMEELGDLLFACAQYARKRHWDPEQVLQKANEKFRARFQNLGRHLQTKHLKMEDLSLEELESYWQKLKH